MLLLRHPTGTKASDEGEKQQDDRHSHAHVTTERGVGEGLDVGNDYGASDGSQQDEEGDGVDEDVHGGLSEGMDEGVKPNVFSDDGVR